MADHGGVIRLHPYQRRAAAAVKAAWREHQSVMLVMPTGTGKTVVFASLLAERLADGRSMVLAHMDPLIRQSVATIRAVTGIAPDVEKADEWADQGWSAFHSPIVVSSIQTQVSGRNGAGRMTRFKPMDFRTLVCDEAHHAVSATWRRTIDHYRSNPDLRILGVTATPNRHDEQALGQIFTADPFVYGLLDAINDGWLVRVRSFTMPIDSLDLSGVSAAGGDLSAGQTGAEMSRSKPLLAMADAIWRESAGRKTLVFAASVEHARLLCGAFNTDFQAGSARHVSGKTGEDERRATLAAYAAREFPILVNCQMLGEGFDARDIEVIVPRPTTSTPAYLQMLGRGTRTLPGVIDSREWDDDQLELGIDGEAECAALRRKLIAESAKPWCEVLDLHCQAGRHSLVTAEDALGGNYGDEVVARAKRDAAKDGLALDPEERLRSAEQAVRNETEVRLRRGKLSYRAKYTKTETDPFSVFGIAAPRQYGWDKRRPPSEKQIAMLRKCRVPTDGLSQSQASALIGEIIERSRTKLPSYRQASALRKAGFDPRMPMREAKPIIDILAAHGWRWPRHIARPPSCADGQPSPPPSPPEHGSTGAGIPQDIIDEYGVPS